MIEETVLYKQYRFFCAENKSQLDCCEWNNQV